MASVGGSTWSATLQIVFSRPFRKQTCLPLRGGAQVPFLNGAIGRFGGHEVPPLHSRRHFGQPASSCLRFSSFALIFFSIAVD
jgi:hypothetical protein